MTFAHPERFALLILVIATVAVYLFARRYHRVAVTYGFIWERLAQRRARAGWRKLLQRAATITISLAMLGALLAALVGARVVPGGELPADIVILLDTSVSTARRGTDGLPGIRAIAMRALEHLKRLRVEDRAWLLDHADGTPRLAGPYTHTNLREAFDRLRRLETDFVPLDPLALTGPLTPWPPRTAFHAADAEATASPPRRHELIVISDHDGRLTEMPWPEPFAGRVHLDLLGAYGYDAAFLSVEMMGDGNARVTGRGGAELKARFASGRDAADHLDDAPGGGKLVRLHLPEGEESITLTLTGEADDPIPENNRIVLRGHERTGLTIGVVADTDLEWFHLRQTLAAIVPGNFTIVRRARGRELNDTLVVTYGLRAVFIGPETRALLSFAALPEQFGEVGEAYPGGTVAGSLRIPAWLAGDETAVAVAGLSVRTIYPIKGEEEGEARAWQPLLRDTRVGTIVSARRLAHVNAVYVAASPFESDVLTAPALPLLLRRWSARLALAPVGRLQRLPLTRTGDALTFVAEREMEVALASEFTHGERRWLTSPVNGRIAFAETWTPGKYAVSPSARRGENRDDPDGFVPYREEVFWLPNPAEVPYGPIPPQRLETWPLTAAVDTLPDWAENLARTLLFTALALSLVEWLLYWLGVLN